MEDSHPLREGMTFIGRTGRFCDIVVSDPVSKKHAVIRSDADGFWISDLGSRVGTFVNGEVLNGETSEAMQLGSDRAGQGEIALGFQLCLGCTDDGFVTLPARESTDC